MINIIKAENLKARKTGEYLTHLIAPVILAAFMFMINSLYNIEGFKEVLNLLELIAIGIPFMIGVVVTLNVEKERQAAGFNGILFVENRLKFFIIKVLRLWILGIIAIIFSIILYSVAIMSFENIVFVINSILIIAITILPIYFIHFFIDMRFSRNISIFLGAIESMISALFITGMGDFIWKYFPCSWAARIFNYYSIIKLTNIDKTIDYWVNTNSDMNFKTVGILLTIGLIILILVLFWYKNWEGKNVEE